ALDRLWQVIQSRRRADPQGSYTARLFSRGRAKIAQKLGEEAVETVIEGVGNNREALVGESADLLYHLLVLWAAAGISPADVAAVIRAVGQIAREQRVADSGYRVLANTGAAAHQEVPHFHMHLFGGRDLRGMLPRQ